MEKLNREEEREAIKGKALKEHARLHNLFNEDRLSFERERKRMIDELINGVKDEIQRERLRAMQKTWDKRMKNAGSKHNRFVLAQHFFWKHVDEVWNPSLKEYSLILNSKTGPEA